MSIHNVVISIEITYGGIIMGALNEYFKLDDGLLCRDLKNGNVATIGTRVPKDGVEIKTMTVGTPDQFIGVSTRTTLGEPPMQTPVDSKNLGENSLAGDVAALGKLQLQKCWAKVGPSI
jgi:hypothetical protein